MDNTRSFNFNPDPPEWDEVDGNGSRKAMPSLFTPGCTMWASSIKERNHAFGEFFSETPLLVASTSRCYRAYVGLYGLAGL